MSTSETIDTAGTASLPFVEELFEQWLHDPESVPADWRAYFDALRGAGGLQGNGLLLADGVCSSRLRPGSARIWRQQRNEGSRHDHDA